VTGDFRPAEAAADAGAIAGERGRSSDGWVRSVCGSEIWTRLTRTPPTGAV
jgi:hypothetical protein